MTAHMRCGCGWQGRRDHALHAPCPVCGGEVEFAPVPGPLLAQLLAERFGDDAVIHNTVPKPTSKEPVQRRQPRPGPRHDPDPFPATQNLGRHRPRYAKAKDLEELLDEWP